MSVRLVEQVATAAELTPGPSVKPHVYIAGPYTLGDVGHNVSTAMTAFADVRDAGYSPFCPHTSHFLDIHWPRTYEDWLDWCLSWVRKCDVVYRLPGESNGADAETALAEALAIPVVHSIDELDAWHEAAKG